MQSLNNILEQQQKQLQFPKKQLQLQAVKVPPQPHQPHQQHQQHQQQQPAKIQLPTEQGPVIKKPIIQPLIVEQPFQQQIKKKSEKKSAKKSNKNKSIKPKKYPSIKKVIPDKKDKHLVDLINEEDSIFNEFKTMEFNIQKMLLKPSSKYEEKINIDTEGKKERTVIKDEKKKRMRRTFTGCSVQSKVTLYEKENDMDSPDDKYYEVKEIYRKCPKKNTQIAQPIV